MPPGAPHCQNRKALARGEMGGFAIGDWSGWGNSRPEKRRRSPPRAAAGLGFRAPPSSPSRDGVLRPPSLSLSPSAAASPLLPIKTDERKLRQREERAFASWPFCFFFLPSPRRSEVFNNWHHDSGRAPSERDTRHPAVARGHVGLEDAWGQARGDLG